MTPPIQPGSAPPQNFCTIDGNRLDADGECPLCRMLGRETGRLPTVAVMIDADKLDRAAVVVAPEAEPTPPPPAKHELSIPGPVDLSVPAEAVLFVPPEDVEQTAARDASADGPAGAGPAAPATPLAPEAKQQRDDPPPPPPPPPPQQAQPLAAPTNEFEKFRRDFNDIRAAGIYAITLVGNSSAGKTWLLNRLKHAFRRGQLGVPSIPPAVNEGQEAPPTFEMEVHVFEGEEAKFAIIDIPGERMRLFNEGNYIAAATVIEAVVYSRALIIAVPSDIVMLGHMFGDIEALVQDERRVVNGVGDTTGLNDRIRDWCAQSFDIDAEKVEPAMKHIMALIDENKKLDQLVDGIFKMAGVISYLKANPEFASGANGIISERLTTQMIESHMRSTRIVPLGGNDGLDFPVILAMTKSDSFLPFVRVHDDAAVVKADKAMLARKENMVVHHMLTTSQALEGQEAFVSDPRRLVMANRPDLIGQIDRWMPMNRIEFVSAFYGHPGTPYVRYRLQHFGVEALMEWIESTYYIATGKHLPNQFGLSGLSQVDRNSLRRARRARLTLEGRKRGAQGRFGFGPASTGEGRP